MTNPFYLAAAGVGVAILIAAYYILRLVTQKEVSNESDSDLLQLRKKTDRHQRISNMLAVAALVMLFLFLGTWFTQLWYTDSFADQVDHEVFLLDRKSSLADEYANQRSLIDLVHAVWITPSHPGGIHAIRHGDFYRARGEYDIAEKQFLGVLGSNSITSAKQVSALASRFETSNDANVGRALAGLGKIYFLTDQPDKAESAYKVAVDVFRRSNEHQLCAAAENNLAILYVSTGKAKLAHSLLADAAHLTSSHPDDKARLSQVVAENLRNISTTAK